MLRFVFLIFEIACVFSMILPAVDRLYQLDVENIVKPEALDMVAELILTIKEKFTMAGPSPELVSAAAGVSLRARALVLFDFLSLAVLKVQLQGFQQLQHVPSKSTTVGII